MGERVQSLITVETKSGKEVEDTDLVVVQDNQGGGFYRGSK